jgi:aspartokinase
MLFDTQTLTRVIERSLDLAESGALSARTRAEYLAQGKRLREQLMHLLGARFDADSAEFKQATDALHETNHALTEARDDEEEVSRTVERLAELADVLDRALRVAGRASS